MADPLGDSVPLTGDPRIDVVTQGSSWGFGAGPQLLTYSFNTIPGGAAWSAEAQGAVAQAMDNLTGGDGNDTCVVDNAKDVVTEAPSGGNDTVKSSIAYVLGAEVENLTLTGAGAIAGTGNTLANLIVGNTGANILMGGDGADTLDGGAGADKLTGGADSDLFLRHSLAEGKDTITDFQTGPGHDVLDISDILSGYSAGHEAEFVQCVTAGGNTTVRVDADGTLNGAKFADVCVLTGVTTTVDALLAEDNLVLNH